MLLHLHQSINYTQPLVTEQRYSDVYDHLLTLLDSLAITSEALLEIEYRLTSELYIFTLSKALYKKSLHDKGESVGALESGDYHFYQSPIPISEGSQLPPLLLRFLISENSLNKDRGSIFIRLFKEKPFEIVTQLFSFKTRVE